MGACSAGSRGPWVWAGLVSPDRPGADMDPLTYPKNGPGGPERQPRRGKGTGGQQVAE